jgi:spore coat polysaccharide biosynthesis predicted glycosyltransferase SpsG
MIYDFVFRFDANDRVGVGHFQRAFALIEKIVERKYSIACVGYVDSLFQVSLAGMGIRVFKVGQGLSCHCLIIDHYDLVESLLYNGLQFSKLILFEDMEVRTHSLPILVVNALGDKEEILRRFPRSEVITGLEYFLFRSDVEKLKGISNRKYAPPPNKTTIMVSLGGTDQRPMLKRICSILVKSLDPSINIVVFCPFSICLPERIDIITSYDPEFIDKATDFDLVICGAGQTFLELLYLNQRPIGVVLADNQKNCAELMSSENALILFPSDNLEDKLISYLSVLGFSSNLAAKSTIVQVPYNTNTMNLGDLMSSKSDSLVDKIVSYLP